MKVLTAAQMREVDRLTIEVQGVPGETLMANAGAAVVRILERRHAAALRGPVLVLCGRGNNGGDGCVVARLLLERGVAVETVLLAEPESLRGDAALHWAALRNRAATDALRSVTSEADWAAVRPRVAAASLIVDAMLGTGLNAPPRGLTAVAIRDCNEHGQRAVRMAVDLPSGLPADGEFAPGIELWDWECVLRATATVTFTAPKVGQVSGKGASYCGRLHVAAIGTAPATLANEAFRFQLTTAGLCRPFTAPRPADAHKGSFGHVLVVGGSAGKSGAVAMAGEAALRAGAGLATAAVPRSVLPIVAGHRPELMTEPLAETAEGTIAAALLAEGYLQFLFAGKTVLALGPGLSRQEETAEVARQLIARAPMPWVLDADGLNAFAGRRSELRAGAAGGVLTPHPGEMARLVETTSGAVQARRIQQAQRLAHETGAITVLKGFRTVTASPDGQVWINPTGNPGMATGGTGDILTGIVAGLIAQFPRVERGLVVAAGVYLHGLAADLAVEAVGEMTLCATDITAYLPQALRRVAATPACAPSELELDLSGPERSATEERTACEEPRH